MSSRKKSYDYDSVMQFCGSGGTLDTTLTDIQKKTKELRILVDEAQELFHGKGKGSSVYKAYNDLYGKIGTVGQSSGGLWKVIDTSKKLIDKMYNNASDDKALDEE